MKRCWALVVGSLIAGSGLAQMTAEQAFQLGNQAAGANTLNAITGLMTEQKAVEVLRGYDPTQKPQGAATYDGNIISSLRTAGNQKAADCGSGITDGSLGSAQHCEAVNSITKHESQHPSNLVTANDPLLQSARGVWADPEATAGKIENIYSDCKTTSKEIAARFSMETCDEWTQSIGASCIVGREVTNDPNYLYQCTETVSTINHGTCSYGRVVQVNKNTNYQCDVAREIENHECSTKAIPVVTVEYIEGDVVNEPAGTILLDSCPSNGVTDCIKVISNGVKQTVQIVIEALKGGYPVPSYRDHLWFDAEVNLPNGSFSGQLCGRRCWQYPGSITCSDKICTVTYTGITGGLAIQRTAIFTKPTGKLEARHTIEVTWEDGCARFKGM